MQDRNKKYPAAAPANPSLERELRRYQIVKSVQFERIYAGLLEGLDLEIFEEEWAGEGVRSFAKEVAIRVHEGETDFDEGLEELRAHYERKRRFHEV